MNPVRILVDTLASYRLTKLIVSDTITAPARAAVFARLGPPEENRFSYLISCPHCTSIYLSFLIALARMIAPNSKILNATTEALAVSALVGIMAEREESF